MKNKILFLLLLIFVFARVLNLDRDLPPGDKTKFGEKDEQAYNFTTLNLYHFGSLSKPIDEHYRIQGSIRTILNNILPYATLLVLGNNYFGLRAGAVLASILIFILLFRLLDKAMPALVPKKKRYALFGIGLFLAFDFGFLVASRNAAPTIFRSLFLLLIITYAHYLAVQSKKKQPLHFLFLGMACSSLVFFSYLTNVFIFAGMLLFALLLGLNERSAPRTGIALFMLLAGAGIAVLIANGIYFHFSGKGLLSSVLAMFDIYNFRIVAEQKSAFGLNSLIALGWAGIRKVLSLLSSNMFAFNFTLLYFVAIACRDTIRLLLKRRTASPLQLLSLSFVVAYAAQSFFYNPDTSKWIVLMAPVFMLAVASALNFHEQSKTWDELSSAKRSMGTGLAFFMTACALAAYRFIRVGLDREFAVLISLSLAILLAVILVMNKSDAEKKQRQLTALLMLSLIPSAFLSLKYCLLNPEFHYRDACRAINRIVGDKNMAGVWSDGFRLYTRGNTFFPWYQVQNAEKHRRGLLDIFERRLADFTVDFPGTDFFDPQAEINAYAKKFQLRRIASLYLGRGTLGQSIWVYKRVETEDQDTSSQGRRP